MQRRVLDSRIDDERRSLEELNVLIEKFADTARQRHVGPKKLNPQTLQRAQSFSLACLYAANLKQLEADEQELVLSGLNKSRIELLRREKIANKREELLATKLRRSRSLSLRVDDLLSSTDIEEQRSLAPIKRCH